MKSRMSEFAGIDGVGSGRRFQSWIDLTGVLGSIVGLGVAEGELRFGVGATIEIGTGVGVGAADGIGVGIGVEFGDGVDAGVGFVLAAIESPGENTTLKAEPDGTGVPLRLATNHFVAATSYSTL